MEQTVLLKGVTLKLEFEIGIFPNIYITCKLKQNNSYGHIDLDNNNSDLYKVKTS